MAAGCRYCCGADQAAHSTRVELTTHVALVPPALPAAWRRRWALGPCTWLTLVQPMSTCHSMRPATCCRSGRWVQEMSSADTSANFRRRCSSIE